MNCDVNIFGDLFGCFVEEMIFFFIEEFKEDYRDIMDEFQYLVETVLEYLVEKEEEINRFGYFLKIEKIFKYNSIVDNVEQKMVGD